MTDTEKLDLLLSELSGIKNNMATKTDVNNVFDKLIKTEKWILDIDDRYKCLSEKVDTLLLKADNTSLLLQLINRQSAELELVKARMDELEKKIS